MATSKNTMWNPWLPLELGKTEVLSEQIKALYPVKICFHEFTVTVCVKISK